MPNCVDCVYFGDEAGICVILSDKLPILAYGREGACVNFERRKTMEKTITISQDRFEYFLQLEVKFELARSIYRNNDTYRADDMLATVLGPRTPKKTKDEPQEQ